MFQTPRPKKTKVKILVKTFYPVEVSEWKWLRLKLIFCNAAYIKRCTILHVIIRHHSLCAPASPVSRATLAGLPSKIYLSKQTRLVVFPWTRNQLLTLESRLATLPVFKWAPRWRLFWPEQKLGQSFSYLKHLFNTNPALDFCGSERVRLHVGYVAHWWPD